MSDQSIDFIVDYEDTFTVIRAYTVLTTEAGDLIFANERDIPFEMFAAGYWKRVKMKGLVDD